MGSPGDSKHCDSMWMDSGALKLCNEDALDLGSFENVHLPHFYSCFPLAVRKVLFSIVSRTVYSSEGGKVEPVKEQEKMLLGQRTYAKSPMKAVGILP